MYFIVHFGHTTEKGDQKVSLGEVVKVAVFRFLIFGSLLIIVLLLSLAFGAQLTIEKDPKKLGIAGGREASKGECPSCIYLDCGPRRQRLHNDLETANAEGVVDPENYCGAGSIVNKNWILTAAHICRDDRPPLTAIAGVRDINEPSWHWQRRRITKFHRHPRWNLSTSVFDLCLMGLDEPFDLTDSNMVAAAHFMDQPNKNEGNPIRSIPVQCGLKLTTFGWGRTFFGAPTYSPVLRVASGLSVLDFEKCRQIFEGADANTEAASISLDAESMFCAFAPKKGPCNGDSGAPIVWSPSDQLSLQVGVVSFGVECAHPYYPNVYASVQTSMNWIEGISSREP